MHTFDCDGLLTLLELRVMITHGYSTLKGLIECNRNNIILVRSVACVRNQYNVD
jgi:hypothetical protein